MPLFRPRLHLRTLLIAVAVIGLAIGGGQMWWKRDYCLRRAGECDGESTHHRFLGHHYAGMAVNLGEMVADVRLIRSVPMATFPWFSSFFQHSIEALIRTFEESEANDRVSRVQHQEADIRFRLAAERYRYVADHPWLPLPPEPGPCPLGADCP